MTKKYIYFIQRKDTGAFYADIDGYDTFISGITSDSGVGSAFIFAAHEDAKAFIPHLKQRSQCKVVKYEIKPVKSRKSDAKIH